MPAATGMEHTLSEREEEGTLVYAALKQHVANRGVPPESFLEALIAWGKSAPMEIFIHRPVIVPIA